MSDLNKRLQVLMEQIRQLGFQEKHTDVLKRTEKQTGQFESIIDDTVLFEPASDDDRLLRKILSKNREKELHQRFCRLKNPFDISISIATWLQNFPEKIYGGRRGLRYINQTSIHADIESEGFDAIAYYRSFHNEPKEAWGIYIKKTGIEHFADYFLKLDILDSSCSRLTLEQCLNISYFFILFHELYHFIVDVVASEQEKFDSQSYYKEYKYGSFSVDEEKPELFEVNHSSMLLEEAVANAFAYRMLLNEYISSRTVDTTLTPNKVSVSATNLVYIAEIAQNIMQRQPDGYRNFDRYIEDGSFAVGNQLIVASILNSSTAQLCEDGFKWLRLALSDLQGLDIPVYLINE